MSAPWPVAPLEVTVDLPWTAYFPRDYTRGKGDIHHFEMMNVPFSVRACQVCCGGWLGRGPLSISPWLGSNQNSGSSRHRPSS